MRRSTDAALAVAGAVSLVFLLLLWTDVLGATGTTALDDYASALAPALAGVACLGAARSASGRLARGWLLLGLGQLAFAAGGVAWAVYEVHLGREVPFPSVADVGYLGSVPLTVAALLYFPGIPTSVAGRVRAVLDGVIAAGALLFVSWVTVLGPAIEAGGETALARTVALAYPVGDIVTATLALVAMSRARGQLRTTMGLIGAGLIMLAVADSSFLWFTARGEYATGNLFDTGYVAGCLLIAIAAMRWKATSATDRRDPEEGRGSVGRLAATLPYLPLLAGVPLAVAQQRSDEPADAFQFYVGVVVLSALLLRQLLTVQLSTALSRRVHDTVDQLRDRERQLQFQAFHDPLTGLANRALFGDRADHALAQTRHRGPVTLLLADLDDFKTVNDTLGHPAGDTLLGAVAERLLAVVGPGDTVARLGGDEFAVLLEAAAPAEAREVAGHIAQALLAPFHLAGIPTVVTASIGIVAAGPATTGAELLRDADIAMYAAKAQGKGRYVVYAVELSAITLGRRQLTGEVGEALARGELSLQYQPVVDLVTGEVVGVEALLRWAHPVHGVVPAEVFVAVAEASGALLPIGTWVLEQALADAARWRRARRPGAPRVQLAVNLSGRQLADPGLVPTLRRVLAATDQPPDGLTLEITDNVRLDDDQTRVQLEALDDLGVRLAIDHFGTGHTRLSRLRMHPVDTLKIDRSFVAALGAGESAPDVLVTAILGLGRGLGLEVIADGVETEAQLAALRRLGCPLAQGYLFARPADPEVIDGLLASGVPLADPMVVAH